MDRDEYSCRGARWGPGGVLGWPDAFHAAAIFASMHLGWQLGVQ
jgi:hypothetical protein